MKRVHACALMLVAAVFASAAQGEGGACAFTLEELSGAGKFTPGVRAVVPENSERAASVQYSCVSDRVSAITVRLKPGQVGEARVMLVDMPEQAPALVSGSGLPAEWSRVAVRRVDAETILVTITISVPASARSGQAFSGHLGLAGISANLDIPVNLEIIEEAPLFRDDFDEFDVDPVIGQFSMVM